LHYPMWRQSEIVRPLGEKRFDGDGQPLLC
jgi:hypothetical protein